MCGFNRGGFESELEFDFTEVSEIDSFVMITSISLGGNNIGAQGAASLGEALKVNRCLTSLG